MNKWFEGLVLMASFVALALLISYAGSMGVLEQITREIQRYSGLTSRHMMLIAFVIMGSFFFGFVSTKVGRRKTI